MERMVSQGPLVLAAASRSADAKRVFHGLLGEGGNRSLKQRAPWNEDKWGYYVCPSSRVTLGKSWFLSGPQWGSQTTRGRLWDRCPGNMEVQ